MDALVELLPLLFIAAYYLLAGRRKAKQKQQRERAANPTEIGARPEATSPSPFQSFLEQLEQSLAEANNLEDEKPKPAPEPEPVVTAPSRPIATRPQEFSAHQGSFDALKPVDHESHGFGVQNPLSEEVFEQSAPFSQRPRSRSRSYDPHDLKPTRSSKPVESWHSRMRDPMAARDAFVYKTVFGERGGRHKSK
ncbi:hypothetical protein [Rubrivirga sp.]|uniref:hypothetical protein n=1 Tax=Rubrivirga sp. TaxID=1885344 RepID=UPI003C75EFE4